MNPALPRSPAGDYNPWLVTACFALAPFMEVLDTTIANVSLTHIAGSLAASQSESTWVLTSYLVSNSIILPISGWLSQVVGRKRFYQICVALFTASSVLCAFSTSLTMIIIARIFQGLGGGGLQPTTQSMMADSFMPHERPKIFAVFGLIIVSAPALGPVLGGWITDNLSWNWIFLINLPVGLVSFSLVQIFVSEPPLLVKERGELLAGGLKLDYFGLFLVAAGFGSLQIFLDKFDLDDGFSSSTICLLCACFVTCLSTLVVWEWQHPQPVMNFRLFKSRNFLICSIVMLFVGFFLLSSSQLLPQLAQTLLGYDSQTSGELLALGGLATISILPLAGFLTGRLKQPAYLMIFALFAVGIALISATYMAPDVSFGMLSLLRVAQVFATPFLFIPVQTLSYVGVPPRGYGEAAALISQMRNIGGSIGISFVTTELTWRTQFHHARLAEAITPYGSLHGMTLAGIAAAVQKQASFLGYLDVFYVIGVLALVIWPLVLFVKPPVARRPAEIS